jgi:hypothetical protein
MSTATPIYTFPGTSRTIDVRTITEIHAAENGSDRIIGRANGEHMSFDCANPAAVCAEVAALKREHYQAPATRADEAECARIMGREAGKAIGEAVSLVIRQALDTDPSARTIATGLIGAVKAGFVRIAGDVAAEIRRKQ